MAPGPERFAVTCMLVSGLVALAVLVPPDVIYSVDGVFLFSLGAIGIWRYSWWAFHAVRSFIYLKLRFPEIRRLVNEAPIQKADHVYCLVTSYAIDPEVSWKVYWALFQELMDYDRPATVVAAVSHQTDVDILRQLAQSLALPAHIEIVFMYQEGTGKRPAMAEALRAISRRMPTGDSVCIFMDGDVMLRKGAIAKTLPVLQAHPDVGAATTDNRGMTEGSGWAREWYDLRFAQRHLLMASMALSDRLLVLTGRFSVIKAPLATHPSFIEQIENDAIDHWRLGRIRFLSGDDKSTWFWLLKRGWKMIYIPDVRADSFEELPSKWLLTGSISLLRRWYGNMLRTSGRAIALGPAQIGFFTWWCLVDQRLSMWTSQVGPILAVILSVSYDPNFMLVYLLWIGGTRTFLTLVVGGLMRGRWAPHWPFLLFYNQVIGGLVKTFVAFRPNRQKWTRQSITGSPGDDDIPDFSASLHLLSVGAFVALLVIYSGAVTIPGVSTVRATLAGQYPGPETGDTTWLRQVLLRLPAGETLPLEEGTSRLDGAIPSERSGRTLLGKDPETVVVVSLSEGAGASGRIWCPRRGPVPPACHIGSPAVITLRGVTVEHSGPTVAATASTGAGS